ncbi:MAG: hypothetical protein IID31_11100, partial [Planctomycetes bacterium]|nr:hypothetical protein [Planctomycetota bacterium]
DAAIEILKNSERPMIVAGTGAGATALPEELQRLVETMGIPIATVDSARGLVSDDHELSIGFGYLPLNRAVARVKEADAVLLLGQQLDYTWGFGGTPPFAPGVRRIVVDASPENIGRSRSVDVAILGDVGPVITQLADAAAKHTWPSFSAWNRSLQDEREKHQAELSELAVESGQQVVTEEAPPEWEAWLRALFPRHVGSFAPHHVEFWQHVWGIQYVDSPDPFVAIWARGGGKALALDTPLPTPTGWTTIGEVRVGDSVLDHRGRPTTVMTTSAVSLESCYRVQFCDGESVVASSDHLWSVLERKDRATWPDGVDWAVDTWDAKDMRPTCVIGGCDSRAHRGALCTAHAERRRRGVSLDTPVRRWSKRPGAPRGAAVMTTDAILKAGLRAGLERRWCIPLAQPFEGFESSLPLHPYVLGAWLGDGHSEGARITSGGEDVDEMELRLSECGVSVRRHERPVGFELSLVDGVLTALREVGVLGDKHIPASYLRASCGQRMSLLRGLMDTDGTATGNGAAAEFVTTRARLADGVHELGVSLGYRVTVSESRATLYGKDCGPMWRLRFAGVGGEVFSRRRKVDAAAKAKNKAHRNTGRVRYITAVEPVPNQAVRCIGVGSPGRLFLAGRGWVPTHNSTSAALAVAALGLRNRRRYVWYVRETQDRADDSLANIAQLLEDSEVERYYPLHAERKMSKFGHSRGWNSTQLRTAGELTIDAIGLDTARRGLKIGEIRPDLIILDDLDAKHDTARATRRKIETLTTSVLPAGTEKTAIIAIQNLIIPHGVFSRLHDGRADFLATRRLSGPVPALEGMKTEIREDEELGRRRAFIVAGEPTWAEQDREACQRLMNLIGLRAFLQEAQHEVGVREGALWKSDDIGRIDKAPPLKRVVVGVDPSGGSAEIGIVVVGLGHDGRGYVLADSTQAGSLGSLNWGRATVDAYDEWEGDRIVAEKNFGGDMVASTINVAAGDRRVPVHMVSASRGKDVRAEPVAALYEKGLISHVGVFPELEAEMTGWVPGDPESPNRVDAMVWAFTELMLVKKEKPSMLWSKKSRAALARQT